VASRQARGGVLPPPKGKKYPLRLSPKPKAPAKPKSPVRKPRPAKVHPVKPHPAPKRPAGKKGPKRPPAPKKKPAHRPAAPRPASRPKARKARRHAPRNFRSFAARSKHHRKPKPFVPKPKAKPVRRPPPPPMADDAIWHSERWVDKEHDPNQDPEMAKLNLALAAVKEDILATNKQINDERRWSIAVHKIVTSYKGKLARVDAHIIALRKEMKALYRKKKQIENLKLQRALETKLKEARAELNILTNSLKHVAVKQGQLNRSGADLRATIAGIQGQLAKLRGQQLFKKKKKCGKGKRFSKKHKKCVKRRKGKGKRKGRKGARKLKRMLKRKL